LKFNPEKVLKALLNASRKKFKKLDSSQTLNAGNFILNPVLSGRENPKQPGSVNASLLAVFLLFLKPFIVLDDRGLYFS
jgi:hypothetical protein